MPVALTAVIVAGVILLLALIGVLFFMVMPRC